MISRAELEQREQQRILWLSAAWISALVLFGQLTSIAIEVRLFPSALLLQLRIAHAALALAVLFGLVQSRGLLTPMRCLAVLIVLQAPLIPIMWIASNMRLRSGLPVDPFIGYRMMILALAMLLPLPPRGVLVCITAVAVLGVAHYARWQLRYGLPGEMGEPWYLLFSWFVGCGVVSFRAVLLQVTAKYRAARAALDALSGLGRHYRVLRDGVSTPVQTVDGVARLLRQKCPDQAEYAARLERAAQRLREVVRLPGQDWEAWSAAEESFRAEDELGGLFARLRADIDFNAPQRSTPGPRHKSQTRERPPGTLERH